MSAITQFVLFSVIGSAANSICKIGLLFLPFIGLDMITLKKNKVEMEKWISELNKKKPWITQTYLSGIQTLPIGLLFSLWPSSFFVAYISLPMESGGSGLGQGKQEWTMSIFIRKKHFTHIRDSIQTQMISFSVEEDCVEPNKFYKTMVRLVDKHQIESGVQSSLLGEKEKEENESPSKPAVNTVQSLWYNGYITLLHNLIARLYKKPVKKEKCDDDSMDLEKGTNTLFKTKYEKTYDTYDSAHEACKHMLQDVKTISRIWFESDCWSRDGLIEEIQIRHLTQHLSQQNTQQLQAVSNILRVAMDRPNECFYPSTTCFVYGPPSTGKSTLGYLLAALTGGVVCDSFSLTKPGYQLTRLFQLTKPDQPLIVVMNEFDKLLIKLIQGGLTIPQNKSVDSQIDINNPKEQINNWFDNLRYQVPNGHQLIVLLTSNTPLPKLQEILDDPSLLRRGRIDGMVTLQQIVSEQRPFLQESEFL
jgi:ATPase family associated with various cellular activities (AAA)